MSEHDHYELQSTLEFVNFLVLEGTVVNARLEGFHLGLLSHSLQYIRCHVNCLHYYKTLPYNTGA
jgi:hypothetical protein